MPTNAAPPRKNLGASTPRYRPPGPIVDMGAYELQVDDDDDDDSSSDSSSDDSGSDDSSSGDESDDDSSD